MRQATLASLAILKVNWDNKGHDYADNFLPFVLEAIQRAERPEISVSDIQKRIREDFGLIIPQGALNTLLRRAERRGAVRREHGIFLRVDTTSDSGFALQRAEVSRSLAALLSKLGAFVHGHFGLNWTEHEAEDALLNHLQTLCIPILAAATDGCAIPPVEQVIANSEYVINAFVAHLFERDSEGFALLETVTKGNMLATALFLPEIGKAEKKFKGLTVYLDTRILLRALGLEGEGLREPAAELLNLLYEMNVTLACFDITLDEVRRILDAAQHALKEPSLLRRGHFSVTEHFVSIGYRASDVELVISQLERSLRRLHIHIKERPAHEKLLTLDETALSKILSLELPNQNPDAQRHDLDCITSVHRLRRGQPKSDIESCEHIFVTSNNGLAIASDLRPLLHRPA